ncbi:MAG: hypothetical protein ACR2K2_05580 [Mycobacteriales bacterium]
MVTHPSGPARAAPLGVHVAWARPCDARRGDHTAPPPGMTGYDSMTGYDR